VCPDSNVKLTKLSMAGSCKVSNQRVVKFHFFETIRLHSAFANIPLKYPAVIIDIAVDQEYIRYVIEADVALSLVN
jgi:hypothetical protein